MPIYNWQSARSRFIVLRLMLTPRVVVDTKKFITTADIPITRMTVLATPSSCLAQAQTESEKAIRISLLTIYHLLLFWFPVIFERAVKSISRSLYLINYSSLSTYLIDIMINIENIMPTRSKTNLFIVAPLNKKWELGHKNQECKINLVATWLPIYPSTIWAATQKTQFLAVSFSWRGSNSKFNRWSD